MDWTPIAPHGGTLVNRLLETAEADSWLRQLSGFPSLRLNPREMSDLDLIACGALSPLQGFMGQADYRSVVRNMRLADGLPWPVPITLSVKAENAGRFSEEDDVGLCDPDGNAIAVLHLAEKYRYDRDEEALSVYRTTDPGHPGVAALQRQGAWYLGGKVSVLSRTPRAEFPAYRLDPVQTRRAFADRGWQTVVGFQTRNPIHRAHEYIQKCALESLDGLLIHPLVGETKADDIPVDVRMKSYETIIEHYFPPGRTMLSVLPAVMRFAGPREAVFHALIRKNYGCTHFIVGRDHAGVGAYYGTYDAQVIFDEFDPNEIGIVPMKFEHAAFCRKCLGMVTAKTCPHDPAEFHVFLSGRKVREMLAAGEVPPPEFSRKEVAQVLIEKLWYPTL